MQDSFLSGKKPLSLDELQRKLTLYTLFLGGVLMLIFGISNFFTEVPFFIVLMKLALSVPFFVGYYLLKNKQPFRGILNVILLLCYFSIIINYLNNQGSNGPTDYTIFLFTIVITALINGALKWVWLVLIFFTYSGLYLAELKGWIPINTLYSSPFERYLDNVLGFFWILGFWVLGLWVLLKNYNAQYKLLIQTKNEKEEANEKLELLNKKKSKLLALLSHDLKAPLASLKLTLELFDLGVLDQSNMESLVKNLKKQSIQMGNVLDNTLNWVMLELEERSDSKEIIHVERMTKDLVDTMEVSASSKNIQLSFQSEGDSAFIEIEVIPIKIILKNLLDNAIKFSNPGEEITVTLQLSEKRLGWEVINAGNALPAKTRNDLFTLLIEPTLGTNAEKGTGIGLSLSKEIAESVGMELGYRHQDGHHVFFLQKRL
jgi:two-component system sensor histidine kinase/response regulator